MNVRKGPFRLWVVFAVLWTIGVALFSWQFIASPWIPPKEYAYLKSDDKFGVVTKGALLATNR